MMIIWTLVALAAAAVVMVVAGAADAEVDERATGVRGYLADVRAGLHTWRAERRGGDARPVPAAEPVDSTFEDLFADTAVQGPAYLGVEDLTETLARARERAARGVPGRLRR